MPVTMVCCAGEGVKVPPLELTIEDAVCSCSDPLPESYLSISEDERRPIGEGWASNVGKAES